VPVDLGMHPHRVILDDNASELDALHWHIHVVILLKNISIMRGKVNVFMQRCFYAKKNAMRRSDC
jgi:hypothetical protein